jgi:hypothetical protein
MRRLVPEPSIERLLTAGPAGWTTLAALVGARPARAVLVTAFDLHGCWTRTRRPHPWDRDREALCGFDDRAGCRRCAGCFYQRR